MKATLYSLTLSHPSRAAEQMLRFKGIEPKVVDFVPGMQPVALRALGFRAGTVPAVKLDGRRIQGSLEIARALERVQADPPLYPGGRRGVEEAERWGEAVLQPIPRRLFRWMLTHSHAMRRWLAEVSGLPFAQVLAGPMLPASMFFARVSDASDEHVRSNLAELPSLMDRVDDLIAEGTLDGEQLTAADFQIGATNRAMLAFPDLVPLLDGRPAEAHARRVLPDYPGPAPHGLPEAWL